MFSRRHVRLQIEEATGREVDHILIYYTRETHMYSGLPSTNRTHVSDHYMSDDGVELGYKISGLDKVMIFDTPRIWGEPALADCDRLEVSKNEN